MSTTTPSRGTASPESDSPPTSTSSAAQFQTLSKHIPHHVITSIPLTVTPASAVSNGSSARPSPAFPAFSPLAMPTPTSLQASPEMVSGLLGQPAIPPMALPPALTSPPPPLSSAVFQSQGPTASAMTEAMSINNKGANMIRRMSNRLRRRTSHSRAERGQSAGPMMRRRSDSNRHITDSGVEFDGYEPEVDFSGSDEAALDDATDMSYFGTSPHGLGISTTARTSISAEHVPAPIRPLALEQGSPLIKVTKRKRKPMIFRIDYEVAKLSWHPSDHSQSIYIDDITELLYGKDASHYHDEYQVKEDERSRFFTITYADPDGTKGRNQKTLHLIAPDTLLYKLWVDQLNIVSRMRIEMMNGFARGGEKSLRTLWLLEMRKRPAETTMSGKSDLEQTIKFGDLRVLCRKLNISCSEQTLMSRFSKVDTEHTGTLNYAQYVQFMRKLLDRKEVREIFKNIKPASESELDYDAFVHFLEHEQRINVAANPVRWQKIFDTYARISRKVNSPSLNAAEPGRSTISSRAFQILLADSAIFPPVAECPVELKLDRPLNEYFISSSHNTYLPSRQYIAPSSVEPYKTALRAGCRCIEIDCWDGNNGRPEVRHGPYTSALAFSDVISVVNQYAFQTCKYPLIISLEVHCGPEQQAVMVQIMQDVFGERLLTAELHPGANVLPSPEELKGKILLKVKAADCPEESTTNASESSQPRRGRGLSSPGVKPIELQQNSFFANAPVASPLSMSPPERSSSFCTTPKWSTTTSTPASIVSSSDDSDLQAVLASPKLKRHKTSKIYPALGELAIYTQGVSFRRKNFEAPELQTYNHVVSLGEGTFLNYVNGVSGKSNDPALVNRHNMRHLMRVYPAGRRVGSTNFDPLTNWRHGVQMSALNWQTYDVPLQLNRAMFAGGADVTGYSLKPTDMRPVDDSTPMGDEDAGASTEETPATMRKGKKLVQFDVEMISAKQLPRQGSKEKDVPTNPFIDLEVYCADEKARGVITGTGGHDKSAHDGLTGQGSPLRMRTSVRFDNGHDPVFNQKFSVSVETRYPSLVFVRWLVWNARTTDGKNESTGGKPIGTYTARLSNLQQGYRFIPLHDNNGEQFLFSTIFCRIGINDEVQLHEPNSSVQSPAGFTTSGYGSSVGSALGAGANAGFSMGSFAIPPSPPFDGGSGSMRRGFFGRVLHRSPSGRRRGAGAAHVPNAAAVDASSRSESNSIAMSRSASMEK